MLTYVKGDVLNAVVPSHYTRMITHISNNKGGWGAGFVVALSKKWKSPENTYRAAKNYRLGDTQFIDVEPGTIVANMIAQDGYYNSYTNPIPIKYDALKLCMESVRDYIKSINTPICITAPKFGAGLAGGDWKTIESIINEIWGDIDVNIYIL